ncbi:cupin domain-containing protein [Ophiostoma piceae UAMH 11346]|uniref:Cupin domain-containing protein n=1 Tax=Ophiostoma piceae (strain UAMH 11346) TaxID=1262450 RepID=S3CPP1_OPHP1|nr:cupin domain-containing protein [Ophiostoma piceae UAMH 11346]
MTTRASRAILISSFISSLIFQSLGYASMASLLPILQEILPMLMPGSVHITKAEELRRPPGLPHHSEDEADPSDQGEQEDDGFESDNDNGNDRDLISDANGDISSATAWRSSTFPRHVQRPSERSHLSPSSELFQQHRPQTSQASQVSQISQTSPRSQQPRPQQSQQQRPRTGKPRIRVANGVSLRDAIVHKSGSLCASVLTVKPQCETVVFHNGEQEAIVYAVSGTAELATLPEDFDEYDENESLRTGSEAGSIRSRPEPAKHTIGAGDFAFIPAWTEHQVRNIEDEGGANVVWVVVRNAGEPTVVPLEGWGGEAK